MTIPKLEKNLALVVSGAAVLVFAVLFITGMSMTD